MSGPPGHSRTSTGGSGYADPTIKRPIPKSPEPGSGASSMLRLMSEPKEGSESMEMGMEELSTDFADRSGHELITPSVRTRQLSMRKSYYYPAVPKKGDGPVSPGMVNTELVGESPPTDLPPLPSGAMPYQIKLVCGSCSGSLGKRISALLSVPQSNVGCTKVEQSGVINITLKEPVASHDVYVVQRCGEHAAGGGDVNSSFMELLFLIRKLKLNRAERVTAVIPYYPYARQDRKTDLRAPLSASAIAQMITKMGADRVVTLDLHSGQVQGAFTSLPFDNLQMKQEFAHWLTDYLRLGDPTSDCDRKKVAVISPDAGGVGRAHALADAIRVGNVVTIVKRRVQAGQVSNMQTVGDVEGMTCIIIDDIVDTAGTLAKACDLLKGLGATRVIACITHGVLSGPACSNISNCQSLECLVVSDSLPQANNLVNCKKLRVLPIAPLLAQVIARHHSEQSVSDLFNQAHATPQSKATPPTAGTGAFPSSPDSSIHHERRESL